MKDLTERCETCGKRKKKDHICPPLWLVWSLGSKIAPNPRKVYAWTRKAAAEKYVHMILGMMAPGLSKSKIVCAVDYFSPAMKLGITKFTVKLRAKEMTA